MLHESCPRSGRSWLAIFLMVQLLVAGCGSRGPVTSVPSVPTPKDLGKLAVIRLGGGADEPSEKDLLDGLKQEGLVQGTSFTIETKDAGGDASRLAGLVDDAVKGGAAVLVTLSPEAARVAAGHAGKLPLAAYTGAVPGEPLGLGASGEDGPRATGAYSPLWRSNLVSIAAACVPKDQRRMGIVIDPGDPVSVAVKDSLLKADLDLMSILPSFEVAEVRSPGETAAAVEDLARRKVTILLLVPGRAIDDRALIGAATKARLPVFGYTEDQAKAGAVLARVPSPRWGGFEIGRRAGRLLKGTDPKALPFAEGTVFETIANRAASKEIGFNVRGEFLRTATFLP